MAQKEEDTVTAQAVLTAIKQEVVAIREDGWFAQDDYGADKLHEQYQEQQSLQSERDQ